MKPIYFLHLALGLSATALSSSGGEAQVSATAVAQDSSVGAPGSQSVGTPASFQPTATATAMYTVGLASSYAHVDASAFTGEIHADFQAAVNDDRFIVGRGAHASGGASLTGNIVLSDGLPPGVATFSAVLEGSYNFSNSIFNYNNRISLDYVAAIGDTGERSGTLYFDPSTTAGLFAVPMTWTQPVHGGQQIDMYFWLHATVDSVVDSVELNALNTFKLTAITLPPGYTYTSDAQGFLSDFGAPPTEPPPTSTVPEPGTYGLFCALGLSALILKRRIRKGRFHFL